MDQADEGQERGTVLWLTLRGAEPSLAVMWVVWMLAAPLLAFLCLDGFGPAGVLVPVFVGGWLLARHVPPPSEAARRYHLDDLEVTVLGPGRAVRRIPWDAVQSVTQQRETLELSTPMGAVRLPLKALRHTAAWAPVLVRVVPRVAAVLWTRLEVGAVRLRPSLEPSTGALAWWMWLPLAAACLAAAGLPGAVVAIVASAAERGVRWLMARARGATLQGRGITVLGPRGRRFVAWPDAVVTASADGLGIGRPGQDGGLVPVDATDFWAAAPVIELRAQLGPDCPSEVSFRARLEDGGVAVVGEIDALN